MVGAALCCQPQRSMINPAEEKREFLTALRKNKLLFTASVHHRLVAERIWSGIIDKGDIGSVNDLAIVLRSLDSVNLRKLAVIAKLNKPTTSLDHKNL